MTFNRQGSSQSLKKLDQKLIKTGFKMKKISNKLLATITGLAFILLPQLTIAEEQAANQGSEGAAAGDSAAQAAIGGVSAGTIAAVVAIAAAAAAISDSGSGGGAITPTPAPAPAP